VTGDPPPGRGQSEIQQAMEDQQHIKPNCKSVRPTGSTSKCRPCMRATFSELHRLSVGAFTLLSQEVGVESARSARMCGYSSRTI
jgi:hypothetical protein